MAIRNKLTAATLACVLGTALIGANSPVLASDAGAFIGGVFATKLLGNISDQTQAQQEQADAAQAAAQRPVPAAPAHKTAQQRLDELDKLAAGGYITPKEYKAKKQKILDSM